MEKEKSKLQQYSAIYEEEIAYGAEEKINLLNANFALNRITGPVIELGCGNGTWTKLLIEKFENLTVVDASIVLLEKIKKKFGAKAICIESLFEEFNPKTQNYSTVLLIGALHHSKNPTQILQNISNWIHPNAKLIVSVPNAGSIHRRLGTKMGIINNAEEISKLGIRQGHERTYTIDLFKEQLIDAGFSIDHFKGLFFKPFSNSQMDLMDNKIFSGLFKLADELPDELAATLYAECSKKN